MADIPVALHVTHVVYKWGGYNGGWLFHQSPSSFFGKEPFSGCPPFMPNTIVVPIDPLTAINLGLVTVQELGFPVEIEAAFKFFSSVKVQS